MSTIVLVDAEEDEGMHHGMYFWIHFMFFCCPPRRPKNLGVLFFLECLHVRGTLILFPDGSLRKFVHVALTGNNHDPFLRIATFLLRSTFMGGSSIENEL